MRMHEAKGVNAMHTNHIKFPDFAAHPFASLPKKQAVSIARSVPRNGRRRLLDNGQVGGLTSADH